MTEADAKQTCDKIRQMAYVLNLDHGLLINFGSSKFQCRHLYRRKWPSPPPSFSSSPFPRPLSPLPSPLHALFVLLC